MIVGVFCLVAWPLMYWLFSPLEWKYARALEAHKRGDVTTAQLAFEQIIESDPSHSLALFRLGEIAFEQKEFEKSVEYTEQALEYARTEQKPHLINLQANAYVALENREEALKSVAKLQAFSTLPKDYAELSDDELLTVMSQPANRHFLNSLAYVSAVADDDLDEALRYINVVIGYFESSEEKSQLAIPYLHERVSNYSLAYSSLIQLANRIKSQVKNREDLESRISELKNLLEENSTDELTRERLERLVGVANHEMLFIAFTRLNLLAKKMNSANAESVTEELDQYRSEFVNEKNAKIELTDAQFVEYAFEMQHYYDTRAVIRLRMGEEIVAKSMGQKDDFPKFLQSMEVANEFYAKAYSDLTYAIQLKTAMEGYLEKFPNNSLAISLPSDHLAMESRERRIKAIEHYHRYLILNALGKIEDAKIYRSKVEQLGFEPNRLLF